MRAEIEHMKSHGWHPVKGGIWGVRQSVNGDDSTQVHECMQRRYLLNTGWTWAFENFTCDRPASHDTPTGATAQKSSGHAAARGYSAVGAFPTQKRCRGVVR